MLSKVLLFPPIAFLLVLGMGVFLSGVFSRLAFKPKKKNTEEAEKAYSCGEEFSEHMIQPDYSQFYSFAFFFTVLHVTALVVATVPKTTGAGFELAVIYVASAFVGLFILLRR